MSRRDTSYVRNAADAVQVALASRLEKDRADQLAGCLKAVLATREGRRVIAELTEGIKASVYDTSGSTMYFNEGKRMLRSEWRGYAEDADPDAVILMDTEMRQLRERILADILAARGKGRRQEDEQPHDD